MTNVEHLPEDEHQPRDKRVRCQRCFTTMTESYSAVCGRCEARARLKEANKAEVIL